MANIIKAVDYSKFTDKQIMALEILCQPRRGGLTFEQVGEAVGVDVKSIYRWRQDPAFVEAMTRKSIMNLHEYLPEVFEATTKRAIKGEVRSVDILLKLLGLYVDRSEVEIIEGSKNEDLAKDIAAMRQKLGQE